MFKRGPVRDILDSQNVSGLEPVELLSVSQCDDIGRVVQRICKLHRWIFDEHKVDAPPAGSSDVLVPYQADVGAAALVCAPNPVHALISPEHPGSDVAGLTLCSFASGNFTQHASRLLSIFHELSVSWTKNEILTASDLYQSGSTAVGSPP